MTEFFQWMICGPNDSWSALLIRFAFGICLLPFGIKKIKNFSNRNQFPSVFGMPPALSYTCATIMESVGALCVMAGFLTRFIAAGMVIQFIIAVKVSMEQTKPTPTMLYLAVAIVILIVGAGQYSVDAWLLSLLSTN